MTTLAAIPAHMTSDEFLVWAEAQSDEKFELHEGVVVAMSRERRLHALVKGIDDFWKGLPSPESGA